MYRFAHSMEYGITKNYFADAGFPHFVWETNLTGIQMLNPAEYEEETFDLNTFLRIWN